VNARRALRLLGRLPLAAAAAAALTALSCRQGPPPPAGDPPEVIYNTAVHTLPRSANGRDYRITVGLPGSYGGRPERRYPIMYITDAYWDFKLLASIEGGLAYDQVAPEFILVGIGYPGEAPDYDRLRRYDLTPVPDPRPEVAAKGPTGHAGELLGVLEREIIPFVEQRYRADSSYRVLGGSSLGGLFAIYVMLTKPALFQAYVAPSPAVAYANDWLFSYEEAFAKAGTPLAARLYLTAAEKEDPAFVDAIKRFEERLHQRAYPGLVHELRVVEGERHSGTKPESFNRGVRFAFAPRMPADAGR
jgi:predicted alpha/beta superfamily hydrolase